MIDRLATVLTSAGLDPSTDELRDALWLVPHLGSATVRTGSAIPGDAADSTANQTPDTPAATPQDPEEPAPPGPESEAQVTLYAASSQGAPDGSRRAMTARAPAVPALRRQLALARSLRPLKRHVSARHSMVVDEDATVERIAEEGVWIPAMAPARERWLDLVIVHDCAPSMVVWRRTLLEFGVLAANLGAFRRIEQIEIDSSAAHRLTVCRPTVQRRSGVARDPSSVLDGNGRQVLVVITDAVGDSWHDGRMHAVLRCWSGVAPIAVFTLLPQRMWRGTGLTVAPAEMHASAAGSASATWDLRARGKGHPARVPGHPIPVVELSPRWLGHWAALVAGGADWHRTAVLIKPETTTAADLPTELNSVELIRRFRAAASPTAFQLACYLSAAWLNLPVMRLVQQAMLPTSETAHLAEVFLGGLLRRCGPADEPADPELVQYEFVGEVRGLLNGYLVRDDLLDILASTSRFVSERFGQALDFAALLDDPDGAPLPALGGDDGPPLAYVAAAVLARLGGRFGVLAQRVQAIPGADPRTRDAEPTGSAGSEEQSDAPTAAQPPPDNTEQINSAPEGLLEQTSRPIGGTPRQLSARYELQELTRYTSMAEVHRARDLRLDRDVAVKILRADLARDPVFYLRFKREAQNSASLNHPAIVEVYDTGEAEVAGGPLPYIVMEYVDGESLRDIIHAHGALSPRRVIEIIADVCAALDFTHKHGLVHRDVKPANILLNRAGAVKLTGFDIARASTDTRSALQSDAHSIIGTALYMSPEQARGEAIDARTDIYSLGCTMFELLTGRPPFQGDQPVAVAYQHVREEPPVPSTINPDIPWQLDAVVLNSLNKNPANRYQTAATMRADLIRVLGNQKPTAPRVMRDPQQLGATPPAASAVGSDPESKDDTETTTPISRRWWARWRRT
jgi:serine/threonine protein kinase